MTIEEASGFLMSVGMLILIIFVLIRKVEALYEIINVQAMEIGKLTRTIELLRRIEDGEAE